MTNQVSPTSEAEEVKAFMESHGFKWSEEGQFWRNNTNPYEIHDVLSHTATFTYRLAKQAEIQGRLEELRGHELLMLHPSIQERVAELEALLSKYKEEK